MYGKRFSGIINPETSRIIRECFYAMAELHGSTSGLTFIGGNNNESTLLSYNYAAVYTLGGIRTLILHVLTDNSVYIPVNGSCIDIDLRYCTLSQLSVTISTMRCKYERIVVEIGTENVELLAAVARYFSCRVVTSSAYSPV